MIDFITTTQLYIGANDNVNETNDSKENLKKITITENWTDIQN